MEHRGSEGIADLLEPTPMQPAEATAVSTAKAVKNELHAESTPEQMVRARPDLTTGELKMPLKESAES
jgi:hypothetical protein